MSQSARFQLTHLEALEAESIYIFREVAAQFERPVLLYSVGKDSSVLLHLARKAFAPGKIPFPLLHIDTGYNFPEVYEFRDRLAKEIGFELIVNRNEDAIADGANPYDLGTLACCGKLQIDALLEALREGGFDAAIGGGRRDEEKSRAKERVFSFRDEYGQWNPKAQRPELWSLFNGKLNPGESIRAFPISNWTELDVWHYIYQENVEIVPLYFSEERTMIERGSLLLPYMADSRLLEGEEPKEIRCRYRTLGCSHCTGAVRSEATTVRDILQEMLQVNTSERVTRLIDYDGKGSMEKKKREGYF